MVMHKLEFPDILKIRLNLLHCDMEPKHRCFITARRQVCEGYVFKGVCLSTEGVSVCPQRGCLSYCMLGSPLGPEADTPSRAHKTLPPGRHPPPSCAVHAGIRSTSGWYAFHCNAFLFQCINHAHHLYRHQDSMVWIGLHPVDGNWAWTNNDPLSGYVLFTDFVTLPPVFST